MSPSFRKTWINKPCLRLLKNFQIWLKEGERTFRPNHLRVMMDLNLRVRSRADLKKKLLLAFDNIFYGADPEKELKELSNNI